MRKSVVTLNGPTQNTLADDNQIASRKAKMNSVQRTYSEILHSLLHVPGVQHGI